MAHRFSRDSTLAGAGAIVALALASAATAACGGIASGGSDAGTAGSKTGASGDSAACATVVVSDYDQSCAVDTDCVAVGEVPECPASACDFCPLEAINESAMPRYATAFASAFASKPPGQVCGCPCAGVAVCRGGQCEGSFCGPPSADTLPACANSGGMCAYSANTTCSSIVQGDGCAYADEICCID
ncbi:MAG TPA: hypothetical protein VK841_16560 [Polyangiaceae bacterium]|jgi:hypothetical protein|nr:hypothetical protein [Polyangiaceae bacterium]